MNETGSSEISGGEGALPDSDPQTNLRKIIMWFGLGIIGLITWAAIAFWPARVAARKGHSIIEPFDGETIPEGGTR